MKFSSFVLLWGLLSAAVAGAFGQGRADSTRMVPIDPLRRAPVNASGASVIVIDSAEIANSTARTFSELLQARRPGLRVFRQGGMASDGALVLLRGPTSVSGPSEPIVIVDGVRVDSRQADSLARGPSMPSRLDDILPEDIARIEVLSGPAAALFGDGAANGVILVTTKSGGPGPIRFSGRATWDVAQIRDNFPANYQRIGVSPTTGQPVFDCTLSAVENKQCTPTGLDVWNPLVQASPFHVGNLARGDIDAAGTTLGARAAMGLSGDYRDGNLPHDDASRIATRAKISRALPWNLSVDASGAYRADNARFGSEILTSGLLGAAQNDVNRGYLDGTQLSDSAIPRQLLRHATAGAQLRWRPLSWLDASVMTGRDRVTAHRSLDWFGPPPPPNQVGNLITYDEHTTNTSGAQINLNYGLPHQIAATTGVGYERNVLLTKSADTAVFNGPPFGFRETEFHGRTTALRIEQSAIVGRQLAIAAAIERLSSSLFGGGAGKEWFPSANISWTPALHLHGSSALRLRAAYAETPNSTTSLASLPQVIVVPFGAPPPRPKLERTKTAELGVDATVGDSGTVSLTAFTSRSIHLWVSNPVFTGLQQSAEMTNRGVEAFAAGPLVDLRHLRWTATFSAAMLHNEVTKLDQPPVYTTRGSIVQGKPYGGVWARTYTYADANHDGIIGTNEVQLGDFTYIGAPLPRFESSLATDITVFGNVVLRATLDYRGSYRLFDASDGSRCRIWLCRGAQDPSAPLSEQAAAAATRLASSTDVAAWTPSVRFMKVREIAIRWMVPSSLSRAIGGPAEVTLAARNLATWTNYRGVDPEISYDLPSALPRENFFTMPLPRELVLRLDFKRQ